MTDKRIKNHFHTHANHIWGFTAVITNAHARVHTHTHTHTHSHMDEQDGLCWWRGSVSHQIGAAAAAAGLVTAEMRRRTMIDRWGERERGASRDITLQSFFFQINKLRGEVRNARWTYLLSIAVSLYMRKEKRQTDGGTVVRNVAGCSRVRRWSGICVSKSEVVCHLRLAVRLELLISSPL